MHIANYITYCFLYLSITFAYQIINFDKPVCSKCIHFEPASSIKYDNSINYGKCKFYGKKDILNGKITYDYASIARKHQSCGENGTQYIEDPNYKLKLKCKLLYDIINKK